MIQLDATLLPRYQYEGGVMHRTSVLPGPYGMAVEGLDLRQDVDDASLRQLVDLLFAHHVLVIRGQHLSNDEYVRFARRWGTPISFIATKNRLEGNPEMIVQSNSARVPPYLRDIAAHWHCDSAYEEVPATATMIYGVTSPAGGETLFANTAAAYDDLPAETKSRIENLQVLHRAGGGRPLPDEVLRRPEDMPADHNKTMVVLPPARHPLVIRHPANGRRALYAVGGTPFEIIGLPRDKGIRLLDDLKQHALKPRYVQSYKLMPGDILIWDNFSVMHRATRIEYSDEPGKARLNYRISVKGLPAVLRNE